MKPPIAPRGFAPRVPLSPLALPLLVLLAFALARSAPAAVQEEPTWPRQFDSASGAFVVYEPQPEELHGDLLTARAAFSLQKSAAQNPTYGVLWFNAHILVDRDSSTVVMRDFDVTRVRLPRITAAEASRYEHLVESEAARWDLSGSYEELQTGLAAAEREKASVANLDNTPPKIVFSYERAILVVYDGAPVTEAIEGTELERVANTPYAIVYDPKERKYYLNGANLWYAATDPLGPWLSTRQPPRAVRDVVPPDTSADDQVLDRAPRVLTATEPTELISFDGPPKYAPLVGGELLYATNTESDVFREVSTQSLYVLIAGRWFRAPSFDGPWAFVRGDELPAAFRHIPLDSPKASVLASVTGTDQAADAVADCEIAQTSAITRGTVDITILYDGDPQFEPIPGTNLEYAVNTDAEVLRADGRYYLCDQGVWYVSDSPYGPWMVSDVRPVGVDDIPPSCPVYDVRYVVIFSVLPDVIYEGYYPGYLGYYPYYGTVVYGTGCRYRGWHGHHHYFPRPCTWGLHARYNPWLRRWSFGYSFGAGFLRTGYRWRSPGHHAAAPWFGPGGFHRPLVARDLSFLRTRPPGRHRPQLPGREPGNLYNRPANAGRVNREALRVPRPGATAPIGRPAGKPNDSFAGKDGRVYRRDASGRWQVVNDRGVWRVTPMPAPKPAPAPSPQPKSRVPLPGRIGQPAPAPKAPPKSPPSGDLESAFRARERAREGIFAPTPPPAAPKPAPAPKPSEPRPTPAPRPAPTPPAFKPEPKPAPPPPAPTPPKRDEDRKPAGDKR